MSLRVLVFVAHSDDEAIGMGGTIKRHVNRGDNVKVVSMTDGVSSRKDIKKKDTIKRLDSSIESSNILGFKWLNTYNFSDNSMDSYPILEIIKCIEKNKNKFQPDIIYTHSGADLNIDHAILAKAVLTAFRPQPSEICKEIRLFEVASSTDFGANIITGSFSPNLFIDISETWKEKALALKAYNSEMREYPHSRSIDGIKNLAKRRGNQVGLNMAEAFEVIRKVEI